MFETLIVQPILNVLTIIYALVPGNDYGIAIILFTILVRFLMWPLLKKQLHQTKKIRELQPDIKRIKEKTKGDKQKEGQLLMELYKERGVNPFGSIGVLLVQLPVLIGLFQGLRRVSDDPNAIVNSAYSWVQNLGFMKEVTADIANFDAHLFTLVDLTRSAFGDAGTYVPALILALLAAGFQFYQSKAMSPDDASSRSLRDIMKDESKGKKADQSEINAAMTKNMKYFFPLLTFAFASQVPAALALYWATGSFVGVMQQQSVLNKDVAEMDASVQDSPSKSPKKNKSNKNNSPSKKRNKKGK